MYCRFVELTLGSALKFSGAHVGSTHPHMQEFLSHVHVHTHASTSEQSHLRVSMLPHGGMQTDRKVDGEARSL